MYEVNTSSKPLWRTSDKRMEFYEGHVVVSSTNVVLWTNLNVAIVSGAGRKGTNSES